jgi:hypothetical protein
LAPERPDCPATRHVSQAGYQNRDKENTKQPNLNTLGTKSLIRLALLSYGGANEEENWPMYRPYVANLLTKLENFVN